MCISVLSLFETVVFHVDYSITPSFLYPVGLLIVEKVGQGRKLKMVCLFQRKPDTPRPCSWYYL